MIITIASGKGGTGKTTVATNLAVSISSSVDNTPVWVLDCDVEEPNCHLFLKPEIYTSEAVGVPVPRVDKEKCTACGKCGQFCEYSAIVALKTVPIIFPELCHGCGGCSLICPENAIIETNRQVGVLEKGQSGNIGFVHGRLRVGEAMSPPLIRAVKKFIFKKGLTLIDAPPGTSCPVIEAIKGSDFVILVTEPTPFGLNDLTLAVDMMKQLNIPFGVLINRADVGDNRVSEYCQTEGIPILLQIPDNRKIAEAYSRGDMIVDVVPGLQETFVKLYFQIKKMRGQYNEKT